MSSPVLCAAILLACALTLSAAQSSCKGRCGDAYYRGSSCQCDYNCLSYDECCKDYESQCTTSNSCKGRCGENFKRGRLCSCDSECVKFKQCCSDFKDHCDAHEGAASATAPVKTSSCHNVNDNKPKVPTQDQVTEQASSSEGNNAADDLIPLVSPTSYPQDDLGDDKDNQIFPNDEFSNNGADPEATPIPESTSGYGSSTADLLDQISPEPTQDPDTLDFGKETFTVFSQTDMTAQIMRKHRPMFAPPMRVTDASDPPSSSDSGTAVPQPTTAAGPIETVGQAEAQPGDDIFPDAQSTDLIVASTDKPEVTTTASFPPSASTGPTTGSSTVLENSPGTSTPASSKPDQTLFPDATTANTQPDDIEKNGEDVTTGPSPADLEDPSISVSPAGNLSELDALTTPTPTSTDAAQDDVTPGVTTADPQKVNPDPTTPTLSETTSKPQDKPEQYKPPPTKPALAKPSSKPETKPLDTAQTLSVDNPRDYQADDSNDTNLCSGRPVGAVTTLRNGTIVVFRGHYFWFLDRNRVPGPAHGITQVWGVPSPIDTVFTRCNCQGKTYILKGDQYWRFENDVLDPGYPKVVETGFDGLRGHITAALSVPQYQRRREAVYFFKRGGLVQKYSYQFGTSPTCGKKAQYALYTTRMVRQAVSPLGPAVNIRTSWRGFPSTITAAVSVPSNREPEGYKYYVFSRSKSYNVRMDSGRPVVAPPTANTSPQSNNFFKCPKKV
ncbi:proteoglycan 4b [Chelmon rostratus]|uniref:proteoglycan 4b n=1 Tax=Chelmon rostratus TaxID=109905 RepID=UPI001BE91E80|nr:proteoglycan 4b [Chelmon rostratus]